MLLKVLNGGGEYKSTVDAFIYVLLVQLCFPALIHILSLLFNSFQIVTSHLLSLLFLI